MRDVNQRRRYKEKKIKKTLNTEPPLLRSLFEYFPRSEHLTTTERDNEHATPFREKEKKEELTTKRYQRNKIL